MHSKTLSRIPRNYINSKYYVPYLNTGPFVPWNPGSQAQTGLQGDRDDGGDAGS